MVSVAIALARAPAAAPPMPSATTKNEPRWPSSNSQAIESRIATSCVRSAMRKQSSLRVRVRPTSVLPNDRVQTRLETFWPMRLCVSPGLSPPSPRGRPLLHVADEPADHRGRLARAGRNGGVQGLEPLELGLRPRLLFERDIGEGEVAPRFLESLHAGWRIRDALEVDERLAQGRERLGEPGRGIGLPGADQRGIRGFSTALWVLAQIPQRLGDLPLLFRPVLFPKPRIGVPERLVGFDELVDAEPAAPDPLEVPHRPVQRAHGLLVALLLQLRQPGLQVLPELPVLAEEGVLHRGPDAVTELLEGGTARQGREAEGDHQSRSREISGRSGHRMGAPAHGVRNWRDLKS